MDELAAQLNFADMDDIGGGDGGIEAAMAMQSANLAGDMRDELH